MRIRTIKPLFWMHEALSSCPPITRLLAIALLNYADDEGYFVAHPKIIKGNLFPLEDDSWDVEESLRELVNAGYLKMHTGRDNRVIGHVINFVSHQVISKPHSSKLKPLIGAEHTCPQQNRIGSIPKSLPELSGSISGTITEASWNVPGGNGREGNGEENEGNGKSGGEHRYISWSLETGWIGFTTEIREQLAKAFRGVDLDVACNESDNWLRKNPSKAKKNNWYNFLTGWMRRSASFPGNRSDEDTNENGLKKEEWVGPTNWNQRPAPDKWEEAFTATFNRPCDYDWAALPPEIQSEIRSVVKRGDSSALTQNE
jgi:hypothetical protein